MDTYQLITTSIFFDFSVWKDNFLFYSRDEKTDIHHVCVS